MTGDGNSIHYAVYRLAQAGYHPDALHIFYPGFSQRWASIQERYATRKSLAAAMRDNLYVRSDR